MKTAHRSRVPVFPLLGLGLGLMLACESASSSATSQPAGDGGAPTADEEAPAEEAEVDEGAAPDEAEAAEGEPEPAVAENEPPPGPEPAVVEDKTVLIIGSSLAATGFGALLEDKLDAHPHVKCHRKAKSATGLARPDFFDWNATAKHEIEARDPDLIVVVMGGNDGQDLVPERSGQKRVHWKAEGWPDAYRERVDGFLALLTGTSRQVLWLGIPRTNTNNLEAKLRIIRGVHEAATAANERAQYLDLTQYVEGEGGGLLKEAVVKGKNREIRGEDGVHFTMSGSRYLADKVYPEVLATIGVPEAEPAAD